MIASASEMLTSASRRAVFMRLRWWCMARVSATRAHCAGGLSEGDGLGARVVVWETGHGGRECSVERQLLGGKRREESRVGSGRGGRLGGRLRVTRGLDVNRRVPPLDPVDRVKGRGCDH